MEFAGTAGKIREGTDLLRIQAALMTPAHFGNDPESRHQRGFLFVWLCVVLFVWQVLELVGRAGELRRTGRKTYD